MRVVLYECCTNISPKLLLKDTNGLPWQYCDNCFPKNQGRGKCLSFIADGQENISIIFNNWEHRERNIQMDILVW